MWPVLQVFTPSVRKIHFRVVIPILKEVSKTTIQTAPAVKQAEEKKNEQPEKTQRLTWEEKRAGRFPGSGSTIAHNSKPNRDELY